MTTLAQYIKGYFGAVTPDELTRIASLFTQKTIKKGDYLLKTGRRCEFMCFVQSGLLRQFVETSDKEVTQWISTPGYFSTDLSSFIFETPARWNIHALVDTEVFSISKEDYQQLPVMVAKWPTLERLFLIRCFTTMEDRIFGHLSLSAQERYDALFEQSPELFQQVPLQYIASMLGMTAETFSRVRKKRNKPIS